MMRQGFNSWSEIASNTERVPRSEAWLLGAMALDDSTALELWRRVDNLYDTTIPGYRCTSWLLEDQMSQLDNRSCIIARIHEMG